MRSSICTELTDLISDEIDKKSNEINCFIDQQEAFESLDHLILLAKLCNDEFRDPTNYIMIDYLPCGSLYVIVNGERSDIAKIATRVPKGQFPVLSCY